MKTANSIAWAMLAMTGLMTAGCVSSQLTTPATGATVNCNLNRSDYEIVGTTTGTSTVEEYVFGLVRIIDEDSNKFQIFGLKFFEDQYSVFGPQAAWPLSMLNPVNVNERAYYKALAATPDADLVIPKSMDSKSETIIPMLQSKTTTTFKGKAIKIKDK